MTLDCSLSRAGAKPSASNQNRDRTEENRTKLMH
jgi:hypothetical protein